MTYYTEHEAYLRVLHARTGALAPECTNPNYLVALRRHIQNWLESVDEAIAKDLENQGRPKA